MDEILEAIASFENDEEKYSYELLKKAREKFAREEEFQEAFKKTSYEIIDKMFKANMTKETITQVTGLTTEEIDKIINE